MTTPNIPTLCQAAIDATEVFKSTPDLDPIRTPLSGLMRVMSAHKVVEKTGAGWAVHPEVYAQLSPEIQGQAEGYARAAAKTLAMETPKPLQAQLAPFQPSVLSVKAYTPQMCQDHPDILFVFGDNMKRYGKKGQSIIRDEPNAVGIPTKIHPGYKDEDMFSDADLDRARTAMQPDVARLRAHVQKGGKVAWPTDNIGTGLAKLPTRAPAIFAHINQVQASLDPETPKYYAGIGSRDTPPEALAKMTRVAQLLHQDKWVLRSGGADGADDAFEQAIRRQDRTLIPGASEIILGWDAFSSKKDTPRHLLKFARQGYLLPNIPDQMVELFQKKMKDRVEKKVPAEKPFGTLIEEQLKQAQDDWAYKNPNAKEAPNLARAILGAGMDDPQQRQIATQALDLVRQYHPAPDRLGRGGVQLQARNGFQVLGPRMDKPVDVVVAWTVGGAGGGGTGQALRLARDQGIRVLDLGHPLYASWTPEQIVAAVKDPQLQPTLPTPVQTSARSSKVRSAEPEF